MSSREVGKVLFSVYIPVYNAEKCLYETVDSVLNQEEQEFELILINDGSTDQSWQMIEKLAEKDNRIITVNQENRGVYETRLRAMEMCRGDYIITLDADDRLKPNLLSTLRKKIDIYAPDIVVYRAEKRSGDKSTPFPELWPDNTLIEDQKIILDKLFFTGSLNSLWTKAIRAKCFHPERADRTYPYAMGEDNIIMVSCMRDAKRVLYITDILYEYHLDYGGLTGRFHQDFYNWYKKRTLMNKDLAEGLGVMEEGYEEKLDLRFLTLAGNYALFSPYRIQNPKEYLNGIRSVALDPEGLQLYQKYKKQLKPRIRFSLMLIYGRHFRILLVLRKISTLLERLILK